MAIKLFKISQYKVTMYQRRTDPSVVPGEHSYFALVQCSGEGWNLYIRFLTSDSALVNNHCEFEYKWGKMYVPGEYFPYYMDLLRNEKPLYAFLNDTTTKYCQIRTNKEPVGEEET